MIFKYVLIGLTLIVLGVFSFVKEWKGFKKEVKEEDSFFYVFIKSFFICIFTGDGLGLLGVILALLGIAFTGLGMKLW